MMRIGLLGCGNIGHIIARHARRFTIASVFDQDASRAQNISSISGASVFTDFDEFIASDIEIVVEAASVEAVRKYACAVLQGGKDLVIMSVGALSDPVFTDAIRKTASANNRIIHVPSGAIFGLDNMKIGRLAPFKKLLLRTTKSPASVGLQASVKRQVFCGKAHDCIRAFPKNVNVSVAMGLAAGADADVELWVDPEVTNNVHELFIEGDFGEAYIRVNNIPSPDNPATSYLAALSILSLLEDLKSPIRVGT
jgi:aspartate dehydrogenase